jgi:hypothetical protein
MFIEYFLMGLNIILLLLIILLQYSKYKEKDNEFAVDKDVINILSVVVFILIVYINVVAKYVVV